MGRGRTRRLHRSGGSPTRSGRRHPHRPSRPLPAPRIERLRTRTTKLVAPKDVADGLTGDVTPVAPGEVHDVGGLRFETVPAYNIAEERLDMHPSGTAGSGTCSSSAVAGITTAETPTRSPSSSRSRRTSRWCRSGARTRWTPRRRRTSCERWSRASRFRCTTGTSCAPVSGRRVPQARGAGPVQVLDPTNPFEQP